MTRQVHLDVYYVSKLNLDKKSITLYTTESAVQVWCLRGRGNGDPMSDVWGLGQGLGDLYIEYSDVKCIMGNGHKDPRNRQTGVKTLPFHNFVGW